MAGGTLRDRRLTPMLILPGHYFVVVNGRSARLTDVPLPLTIDNPLMQLIMDDPFK
jgi:hypothetical protein